MDRKSLDLDLLGLVPQLSAVMAATCNAVAPDPLHVLSNSFMDDVIDAKANGATKVDESSKADHLSNGSYPVHKEDNWIPIREEVLWKPTRKLRVVSIGAGFSGKKREDFVRVPGEDSKRLRNNSRE